MFKSKKTLLPLFIAMILSANLFCMEDSDSNMDIENEPTICELSYKFVPGLETGLNQTYSPKPPHRRRLKKHANRKSFSAPKDKDIIVQLSLTDERKEFLQKVMPFFHEAKDYIMHNDTFNITCLCFNHTTIGVLKEQIAQITGIPAIYLEIVAEQICEDDEKVLITSKTAPLLLEIVG